jgi:hypothetical protein
MREFVGIGASQVSEQGRVVSSYLMTSRFLDPGRICEQELGRRCAGELTSVTINWLITKRNDRVTW